MYQWDANGHEDIRKNCWWTFFAFLVAFFFIFSTYGHAQNKSGTPTGALRWAWIHVKVTHVRQQPSVKSPVLEILRKGQLVRVLKTDKGWTEVEYEFEKAGWIFSKNLSIGLPSKLPMADRILYVRGRRVGDKGLVEIYFNGTVGDQVKIFKMMAPSRLVLDLHGFKSPRNKSYTLTGNPVVTAIKIGTHPDKSRLVLSLNKKIEKYSHGMDKKKNAITLALLFGGRNVKTRPVTGSYAPKKLQKERARAVPIRIIKTGFRDEADRSIVVLNVTGKPASYYIKFKKGKVGLIIDNALIRKRYMRFLDTSAFPTPVKRVEFKNFRNPREGQEAEVWVTMDTMTPYDVVETPHSVEWIFHKPETYIAKYKATMKMQRHPVSEKTSPAPSPSAASPVKKTAVQKMVQHARTTQSHSLAFPKKKYTGAKMSFDFQQADIHNVLRLIAEVSNLNIVAGDDVRGKITLRLKNVPWDQALDIILESEGLGKQRIGNVLRIAPISKLKKEMQEKISAKKTVEKLEPLVTTYIPVNYTTAKDLSVKVKPILSSRGTVMVDDRTNTLIIKDIAKKVKGVKALVKKLDTPTPEVLIESRIVEASKEFTREIGIKWGANYNAGPQYGNAPSGNFPNQMNVRGGATGQAGGGTSGGGTTGGGGGSSTMPSGVLPNVNLPATASYGALGITLEQVANIFTLDAELTAMEDNGKGRVISSPRIATLDNKTAKIEQGLRIPYLKITEEGTVTTEFIEANLNMEVTPHVSNDKMINMQVQVSKDTPDWSHLVQGVPSIDKKEATTNVMVKDGGVTAIGGIFTVERSNSIHKVPFFGDIPILGWAFKNKRVVKNRKELLIFISPKLIPLKDNRKD